MSQALALAAASGFLTLVTLGQIVSNQPTFLAADTHPSGKTARDGMRPPSARGELYQVKNATMADLVAFAYNTNAAKVFEGPSWLEMDRFDVIAKIPPRTSLDTQRLMLRALLSERFKLVARQENRPMPAYSLMAGTRLRMKAADGSGDSGCKPVVSTSTTGPAIITMLPGNDAPVRISLESGVLEYNCRNITMAAFAPAIRTLLAVNLGQAPVADETGLKGVWNFDLRYSIPIIGAQGAGEQITIFEAIDKQLGLKLIEKPIPTEVVVVESVERKPIPNPPGTAEALPTVTAPKEFDVATIKPTAPGAQIIRTQMQPTGRFTAEGMPLSALITRAFNANFSGTIVGVPTWAERSRFDITAQADPGSETVLDTETVATLVLSLLKDRFKLAYHTEPREVQAYDLVSGKPKLTNADPSQRSWCKPPSDVPGSAPAPRGTQSLICQNVTMSQFAELLRGRAPGLDVPIQDLTGLEGAWSFRLNFNPLAGVLPAQAAAPAPQAGATVSAPEPTFVGDSLLEALEKQLGLKLEKTKRVFTVTVIDHVDEMPSEN